MHFFFFTFYTALCYLPAFCLFSLVFCPLTSMKRKKYFISSITCSTSCRLLSFISSDSLTLYLPISPSPSLSLSLPLPLSLSLSLRVQVEFYVNENTFKERLKLFFIKNQRSSELPLCLGVTPPLSVFILELISSPCSLFFFHMSCCNFLIEEICFISMCVVCCHACSAFHHQLFNLLAIPLSDWFICLCR